MKKKKKPRCSTCGAVATKRIHNPIRIDLCSSCWQEVEDVIREETDISVVMRPTAAQVQSLSIDAKAETLACDVVHTWRARDKAEYDRALELGVVQEDWDSYEEYDEHINELVASTVTPILFISATPDEILDGLKEYGLPNTPDGRAELYWLLR
jgi:hypothetical protein